MKRSIFMVLLSCLSFASLSQSADIRQKHFNIKKSIGLEGYDPVSYFNGKPVEGSEKISFSAQGVTYLFSSASNRERFKSDPAKYEPAYGGWCAFAMGESGEKVKVDPETFKIIDGKLYLFYNFWGNNTLEDWNKKEMKLKMAADVNWAKTLK